MGIPQILMVIILSLGFIRSCSQISEKADSPGIALFAGFIVLLIYALYIGLLYWGGFWS